MKCNNCGAEIKDLMLDMFNYDGSDTFHKHNIVDEQSESGAVIIETTPNWTGYELTENEMRDTIECPICHRFPFTHKEIQIYTVIKVVCFNDKEKE